MAVRTKEADPCTIPARSRGRTVLQTVGLILWSLLTMVMVVGAGYLARMDLLQKLMTDQQRLLLAAASQSMMHQGALVVSDLRYLGDSQILRTYLTKPSRTGENQVRLLLSEVIARQPEYHSIRLINSATNDLIVQDRQQLRAGQSLSNGDFGDDRMTGTRSFSGGRSVPTVDNEQQKFRQQQSGADHSSAPLQFTTAVATAVGEVRGYLTIVYGADRLLLQKEGPIGGNFGSLYLRDRDGHYLIKPVSARGAGEATRDDSCWTKLFGDIGQDFWQDLVVDQELPRSCQDTRLVFKLLQPFSGRLFDALQSPQSVPGNHTYQVDQQSQWLLISELPASYFVEQRNRSLKFMGLIAVALMVPSIFVYFLLVRIWQRLTVERILPIEQQHPVEAREQKSQNGRRQPAVKKLQVSAEIFERLEAETDLKSLTDLVSAVVDSIDGIIYVADMDTHELLFANDYLTQLLGFEPVGNTCWQLLYASPPGPCSFCNNEALIDRDGEPTKPQFREYQNPLNKRWYRAKEQAIRWPDGRLVRLAVALDITAQKQSQQFLAAARKQAKLSKGAQAKLVALVAHDLKSPFLSIIQMIRRILARETFSDIVHQQFLENIVENAHRMLLMIDNLLSLDRFATGDLTLSRTFFDVKMMADEVRGNFQQRASEKNIRLENHIIAGSKLYADQYLYLMILNNLVSNAIKFCERGGTIELYQPAQSNKMTVAVKDNGNGMSEAYIKDLFRADVKTSRPGTGGEQGSGLGLVFCQEIIHAHGGQIRVDSPCDEGTIVTIELPACCEYNGA